MAKKDFRDVAIVALGLCTAYGLGILSCVCYEIKLIAECCAAKRE